MSTAIFPPELNTIKEVLYDACGFQLSDLKLNAESNEYEACSFVLNGKNMHARFSKITPTKTGQFVTIWKRNKDGITEPYSVSDTFDFLVVTARSGNKYGQFIFPKLVLASKGIVSQNGKGGKRGIRVYPSWDAAESKQAAATQSWQTKYFLRMDMELAEAIESAKKLLG